jgi:hypothetical protein
MEPAAKPPAVAPEGEVAALELKLGRELPERLQEPRSQIVAAQAPYWPAGITPSRSA